MGGNGKHGSALRMLGSKLGRMALSAALISSCCFPSLALAQVEPGGAFAAASAVGATAVAGETSVTAAYSMDLQDVDTFAGDLADSARGAEANPYRISTVADLQALAATVNGGDDLAGKYIVLQNDIAFDDGTAWTPIGNESTSFGGTFDGAGHTISNFHVSTTAVKYVGLFGAVSPAKSSSPAAAIKNLRLVGAHATDGSTDADVQGDLANYQAITGGLVGWVGSRAVSISNCVVDVNVKGTWRVGGIVGGSSNGCTALSISNCLSSGNVYGYDGGDTPSAYIGGIVGDWAAFTYASMANCLYLGQVTPSAGALATDNNTWRLTSNALIGRVGSTSNKTVPTALQQNNWHVAQAEQTVKAMRAGSANSVNQVEGNVTAAPTEGTAPGIAKNVNGGQNPQAWNVLDRLVPVPSPFGEAVEYPPTVHSIVFEPNGGTWAQGVEGTLPTLFAEGGEARELPDASSISRSGYVFKGWHLTSDFTGDAVTTVPTDSTTDLVFYAKWVRLVTVTFDAGAGSFNGETSKTLEAGKLLSRPVDPTPPAGKDFTGWFVKGSASTSLAWDFSTDAVNDDLTLEARYRGETVQVVFDPNGGTLGAGTESPVEVEKGTPVARPAKNPTRDGYTFAGWQLDGGAYDFSFAVNLPTTLVAAWTKNPPAKPSLETGDAAYNLDDVQYVVGEEPSELHVIASLSNASAGTLSYQWYRAASIAQNPAADTRLGRGQTCLPDVSAVGTWYYYCVVSNTLDGDVTTVASSSARVQVVASSAAIENTFPADPSAVDEITLSTRADFEAFRDAVNAGTLYDKTVRLVHDIDLAGNQANQWTPIGTISSFKSGKPAQATGFSGTFDGRGHTVSGLYINASTGGQALFAYLPAGSTLRNFVVKGSVTANGSCVAGVVGAAPRSRDAVAVRNVGSEVDVTSTATSDYVYAGGIIGFAEYATTEVSGCYNAGSVTTNCSYAYVGGIVGSDGAVSDCYNVGAVTANNSNSNTYCGGIAGQATNGNGSLARCYNNASVTLGGSGTNCGAIVGAAPASAVSSCYYNPSAAVAYGSSAGNGGSAVLAGISGYASAASLLEFLTAVAPSQWQDGSAINVQRGGTPALAWQVSDAQTYTIGTAPAANGSFSVSHSVATAGMRIEVDVFPNAGYVLDAITVTDTAGNAVDVADEAFTMPAANVTVAVSFKEAPRVLYKVGKVAAENGSFTTDVDEALVNAKVTVLATPDSGYEVASISVKDAHGRDVAVTGAAFVMPTSDVTVTVTFRQCSYMDARITVNPVAGETVDEQYMIQLVDEEYGTVYLPSNSFASGTARIYLFSAAEGHTYRVEPGPGEYELAAPAEIYLNPLQGGVITKSVQLKYKDVEYTVTFDPGEGSFAEGADADLVDGRVVRTVANGLSVAAPAVAPQREGYVFAGWYEGETRFLSYVPVTANATYTARWIDPSQVTGDTFLADIGGARDGSYAAPYRVTTEQDLRELAVVVNGASAENGAWVDVAPANPLAGKFVSLESDIELTEALTPIGIGSAAPSGAYRARPFSGTFLGGGHVISGLTVSSASNPEFSGAGSLNSTLVTHHGAGAYSALFGAVSGATIQDLTVQLGEGGLDTMAPCAGLVVLAGAGMTRIGHCGVEGAVSGSQGSTGANIAGGLVALFDPAGASGALKVDHCYQTGSVSSANMAGGLVGAVAASGAAIQSSYHVGSVSAATCGSFIGGSTADGASSTVSACATDCPESMAAVGGNATAYAKLDGNLAGLTASDWAAGDGDSGARAALGSTYFDFDDAHADGSPKLRAGVVWTSGYGVSFTPGADDVTGSVPSLPDQDAGAKVVLPETALSRDGYTFAGWQRADGEDAAVYQPGAAFAMPAHAVELVAVWEKVAVPEPDPEPAVYTITFVDEDGSTVLFAAADYEEGTAAAEISRPKNPVKPSTAEYDYEFAGWDPEIADVSANVTYRAIYTAKKRFYKVTWKNGSTVLATKMLAYGAKPAYSGKTPVKASDVGYTYAFSGWSPSVGAVTGATTYTAQFKKTARVSIAKAKVKLKAASHAYTGAVQKGVVSQVMLAGKALKVGVDYQVTGVKSGKNVGSYQVTVTGIGSYKGTASAAFKVTPAANKVTAKGAKKTLKAKKSGKKRALAKTSTLKLASLLKASAKTPLRFAKANKAGGAKISVGASGKLKAKKGLKAGTYNVKVRLTAPAKGNYAAAAAKTVTLKLVVN